MAMAKWVTGRPKSLFQVEPLIAQRAPDSQRGHTTTPKPCPQCGEMDHCLRTPSVIKALFPVIHTALYWRSSSSYSINMKTLSPLCIMCPLPSTESPGITKTNHLWGIVSSLEGSRPIILIMILSGCIKNKPNSFNGPRNMPLLGAPLASGSIPLSQ